MSKTQAEYLKMVKRDGWALQYALEKKRTAAGNSGGGIKTTVREMIIGRRQWLLRCTA
jgi:hypothetical protein